MKPNRSTVLTGHVKHCPCCSTELVIKDHIHVCPRNEIGDCYFDGYDQHEQRANTDFIDSGFVEVISRQKKCSANRVIVRCILRSCKLS